MKYKDRYINYKSYLASDYWIEVKDKHYQDPDNKYCNICGGEKNLQVHHKRYFKTKGNSTRSILYHEQPSDLQTLCMECHYQLHEKMKEEALIKKLGTVAYFKIKRDKGLIIC